MTTYPDTEPLHHPESITIGQLAADFGWTTRFIEGLVRGEKLPGSQIDGQWLFNRGEVLEWLEQKIRTLDHTRVNELETALESSLLADGTFRTTRTDRLTSRLPQKGIALDVPATNKTELLESIATLAEATGLLFDRTQLLDSLTAREALCTTAVPGGLALCHPRRPIPSVIERQFLCFLRTAKPIDFGAENGELTSLFFLLCTPDDRSHLHGLARLARILRPETLQALHEARDADDVTAALIHAESTIPSHR